MALLYSIAIHCYGFILSVASLFNSKAARLVAGRKELSKQLQQFKTKYPSAQSCVWFHVASVGEFEQALPVYEELKSQYPNLAYLFSFYSPSGFDYTARKYPELAIVYLPLDTASKMKQVISALNPSLVIIVKYEFWYHLLTQLKQQQIPTVLISGIFRKKQPFFHPILGSFFKRMLFCFNQVFVQNEESMTLLQPLLHNRVSLSGDTRAERVQHNKRALLEDPILNVFCNQSSVFMAGSVWKEDEETLQAILHALPPSYKVVLAPHEFQHYSFSWNPDEITHYTQFDSSKRILILDTLGVLSRAYRFATLVYVGGGFGKGIHNILEPAVFGVPVLFGPQHQKFNEARELTTLGCAFPIQNGKEAAVLVHDLLKNDSRMTEIRHKLAHYFADRANISHEIVVFLKKYLSP